MCVVSMIMAHYDDEWSRRLQDLQRTAPSPFGWPQTSPPPPTQQEIDEFRRLLDRAREYDRKNGEPDCELEEKRTRIRKLAEELGVKVDFV